MVMWLNVSFKFIMQCDKLGKCGHEVVVIAADIERSTTSVFGTDKAVQYIDCQPKIELNLLSFCDGKCPFSILYVLNLWLHLPLSIEGQLQ